MKKDSENYIKDNSVKPFFYEDKWYYFGKCTPKPIQVDGYPNSPYKQFDSKKECQKYIDSINFKKNEKESNKV